ncbi:SAM-dependent methyltransferase [Streptomyces sp. SID8361]|uniref:SAM-dependent methyltransferase n=1 Tax=Streptomyces sp. MnatMP-M27 TaxID=1839768 RepID=UPI00081DCB23|nr:SAM-dependent methyltransferase [Streptomyces sp. MnatMP-M27]MYU18733.1 SAM-dependent methyltransferase [Streptomyces sp. SID8361]SCG13173.1 S-adenosyl methyltransferase [Streptomyces sp. MnatMP-M27]
MAENGFRAEEIDTSRPHPARIYDYLLGGKNNYEVDREAADRLATAAPEVWSGVRANRDFLRRAVRYVVGSGVRQLLDIGTGLPSSPNVHEIARELAPDARVAYVDNDPIVNTYANVLLRGSDSTSIALADLRDPRAVLDHPEVRQVIDFGEPVAVLLVAIVHFLTEAEEPERILATLRDALPDGSFLVLSHATDDFADRSAAQAVYDDATAALTLRSRARIEHFFDGFTLVEPGLAEVPFWRPDTPPPTGPGEIGYYGGVARKTG